MDVEECPSLVDSEETPKEQQMPTKVKRHETLGLGEVTVHGG